MEGGKKNCWVLPTTFFTKYCAGRKILYSPLSVPPSRILYIAVPSLTRCEHLTWRPPHLSGGVFSTKKHPTHTQYRQMFGMLLLFEIYTGFRALLQLYYFVKMPNYKQMRVLHLTNQLALHIKLRKLKLIFHSASQLQSKENGTKFRCRNILDWNFKVTF